MRFSDTSSDLSDADPDRVDTLPLERQYSCVQTAQLPSGGTFQHLYLTPPVHHEKPGAPIVVAPGTPMVLAINAKVPFLSR